MSVYICENCGNAVICPLLRRYYAAASACARALRIHCWRRYEPLRSARAAGAKRRERTAAANARGTQYELHRSRTTMMVYECRDAAVKRRPETLLRRAAAANALWQARLPTIRPAAAPRRKRASLAENAMRVVCVRCQEEVVQQTNCGTKRATKICCAPPPAAKRRAAAKIRRPRKI